MLIEYAHHAAAFRYRLHGFVRRRIRISKADITFMERSSADTRTPLLFVHGLGTSSSSWIRILPRLPRARRIVCVDLPGFGSSTIHPPDGSLTMTLLDESLAAFVGKIFQEKFILVGHSLGGWLSMRLAARTPERLAQLVLINPAGVSYAGAEEQIRLFAVNNSADVLRLMDAMWYRYPWIFRPLAGAVATELRRRRVLEFIDSITLGDIVNSQLGAISVPVWIIWGINDRLIREEALCILQNSIHRSKTSLINRCGHIPQLERPRELAAILNDVLEECDGVDR